MKKYFVWVLIILIGLNVTVLCSATSLGQETLTNSAGPVAANAGRVVTPREILSIEDTGEKYYFKYPHNIKIGPDGSVFLIDENQFLQFDTSGKFVRNLFKKGQGPGEMTQMDNFVFNNGAIVAFSSYPAKLIWFDGAGKPFKNVTLSPKSGILKLHGRIGSRWVFETFEFPRHSGDPAYVDQSHQLLARNEANNDWTPLSAFPVRIYVVPSSAGSSGFFDVGNFLAVPMDDRSLAVSHTPEYLIKIFDVETNKIVQSFRRSYVRVPPPPLKPGQHRGRIMMNNVSYEAPELKFANDISNILVRGGRLWVITSTTDKKKGVVVDVFDGVGTYQDSFYLNLPESALNALRYSSTCALTDEALWTIERTEEGTCVIKKYKIEG